MMRMIMPGRRPPLSPRSGILFVCSLLGSALPAFFSESGFATAFGNYLLVTATGLGCIAWFSYLKGDGLALFNPGGLSRIFRPRADEWRDRFPLPRATPGPSDDTSGDASTDHTSGGAGHSGIEKGSGVPGAASGPSSESVRERRREARKLQTDLAVAGLGTLVVSLFFQYAVSGFFTP